MRELNKRTITDRRKYPTHGLSRFTLRGRRRTFRRSEDQEKGGYVDRYGPGLLFLIVLIAGLNILDAVLTMVILENGGWEMNPVVCASIQLYGNRFWVWKFAMVSISLMLLCLHSKFRLAMPAILAVTALYITVVFYQVLLLVY